jgi:hypothetical protein
MQRKVVPIQPQTLRPPSHWPTLFLLAGVTLIAFGNLGRADFSSLDDPFNIATNPRMNPPSWANVAHYWITQHEYGLYIPFTYTLWSALAAIAYLKQPDEWGIHLNPYVFHSANVLIHLCSVLAAYGLLWLLLRRRWAASIGALFYGLHPIQVEAVGWAAGMKDVLSGMLSLVALWQYVISAKEPAHKRWGHYAVATLALILAMLSKPSAMMTPLIAVVIDLFLLRRPWRRVLNEILPWLVLAIACAVNARIAQPGTGIVPPPLWARPLIVGDSLAFYLGKILWPIHLAIDYGHRPQIVMQHRWFYFAWIIPAIIAVIVTLYRKRYPEVFVGALIFVLATAPVLGAVTFLFQYFSTTADHYVYLAMIGPGLIVGWLVGRFGRGAMITMSILLALLAVRTVLQTQVWQNDISLFSRTLEVNPGSVMAMNNLGQAYFRQRKLDDAQSLFEHAVAIQPDHFEANENLANLLKVRGQFDKAVEHRKTALEIRMNRPKEIQGDIAGEMNEVGQDLLDAKRPEEARAYFIDALKQRPDFPQARENLKQAEEKIRSSSTAPASGEGA